MMTFPQTTHDMADFVTGRLTCCDGWGRRRLLEWIQWFVNNDRYFAVAKGDNLVGVTFVRLVDNEKDCHEHYRDTGGSVCYVEAAVCTHPDAMRSLYRLLWNSIGKEADKMAWVRHKYGGRATMVDMEKAKRRFTRR